MKLYLTIFLLLVSSLSLAGQTRKFATTVEIDIQTENTELEQAIYGYVSNQLRSLNDVSIVDENAKFKLIIVTKDLNTRSGEFKGYALAVVWTKTYTTKACDPPAANNKNAEILTFDDFLGVSNFSTGRNELEKTCEELVAGFDKNVLEEERKLFREGGSKNQNQIGQNR